MTIEICVAHNNDIDEWNTIISQSPHGTLFHYWNWLKITEKHTNMKLYPLIGIKGSTTIGIFPLFFQQKGPVRMVFSPPPHAALFYLGPVFARYDDLRQKNHFNNYLDFQNSVEFFINKYLKPHYTSIALTPYFNDARPFSWSGYTVEPNYDYVIDLSVGMDNLLSTLDKRGRQNLNHAKKKGMRIEIGGKKEYEKILDLMEIRYAQQGKILTASRQYYLDIYDAYNDHLKVFVAYVHDEIVSGSIEIQYRDSHFSWIGNPKSKNPISPSPNDLLIWESIRYAYEQGFRYYITMNAAGNKRLHSYYASKFNPELKVHFSMKKNSLFAGVLEKVYTGFLKPQTGKTSRLFKKITEKRRI
jgi:hypothetical protein